MNRLDKCKCEGAGFCSVYQKQVCQEVYDMCSSSQEYRDYFVSLMTEEEVKKMKEEEKIRQNMENYDPEEKSPIDATASDNAIANAVIGEMKQIGIDEKNVDKYSEGLGDTVSKILSSLGVSEERIEKLAGIGGCGCGSRKSFLNKIFPYKNKEDK
mgnify:FL=1